MNAELTFSTENSRHAPGEWKVRLLAEHQHLETLFQAVLEAFEANAREETQRLWRVLDEALEHHLALEEAVFFPRFATVDASEVRDLVDEHDEIRRLCTELGAGVDLKVVRATVAAKFIEKLRAHASRENALLYEWVEATAATDEGLRTVLDARGHHRERR